ncbi:putative transmembrane anti-sigma factor [Frankia canadensis]|uniref:Putative transmembrane anti-sigma factor n=1 Tax=Frankia canadensis TaxID=1836972 RepID=A0A2I2KKH5_9ACTN|nr:zf-HC2 domain-containing protein [Frankia canadensis]SNQ46171.1 putative transmembrane anti-sigma factor [Frankia canadensis]SOU53461.1 putative transmembrane anti-sigma factor [Frankia canadensis]
MNEMLPAYAAGSLRGADRDRVRAHLAGCARCRADLAAWRAIADASAPGDAAPDTASLVRAALTRSAIEGPADPPGDGPWARRPRYAAALVVAEARLIRLAVPVASALVMALGVAVVLFQAVGVTRPATGADIVLALVAPIVAAAGVAGTYRSRRDPAAELVAATPTAGPLLLLVRLALVFGYDLALAVAASVALTASGAGGAASGAASLHALIAAWLGPMALLSSVSLLVAVRFGPDVALGAAIGLWVVRVLAGGVFAGDAWLARFIVDAWSTNAAVLGVSAVFGIAAVMMAGRLGPYDGEPNGGWRATHPM